MGEKGGSLQIVCVVGDLGEDFGRGVPVFVGGCLVEGFLEGILGDFLLSKWE